MSKKERIAALEARVAELEARLAEQEEGAGFDEKRVVDLIVRLTTEHVGRLLRESFDEKRLVDAIVGHTVKDVEGLLRRRLDPFHPDRLADAIAARLAERDDPDPSS
ncbi:MAG TPA: hypothetical protein RMH85_29265 [Polyangiaceae bacterium LLY-WYZ-15_(1-7)]|nr:hypothetical protein [Sandaracinus sp.]HJL02791.1 hypothetical protein [Polyangiaceae bacterium LLY-WYZ-15_(1-7)]MBJ70968.1 hypothetical protein [Sandaracinus sp.]HJL12606.1 hypothetical protein [Polyangiaceae bacterium LLY-WYZ-15_(1-7)]HJL20729.1 hypothetical protein [Polyangiaceae bacterium LLY-WYZ-15_(1-7)]